MQKDSDNLMASSIIVLGHMWNCENGSYGFLGSYWLGLENVHRLAPISKDIWILHIELHGDHCASRGCLGPSDGYWWAEWPFKLGDASQRYLLELGKVIRGNLTDKKSDFFQRNDFHPFTTADSDNDDDHPNCAQFRHFGGWWHEKCGSVALNGMYGDTTPIHRYMMYLVQQNLEKGYRRRVVHPKKSIMMIKPNSST
ncbi:Fibrinogen beta and gamma chain globular domain protein [Trichostrongylus colubriformis]|uniref:Fibrinogen beta and gamma chain globular domain protein n=1 Tax=Trichostrongylus colubriformis TaxID=6319 RepID=A0AAN8FML7_TRICO